MLWVLFVFIVDENFHAKFRVRELRLFHELAVVPLLVCHVVVHHSLNSGDGDECNSDAHTDCTKAAKEVPVWIRGHNEKFQRNVDLCAPYILNVLLPAHERQDS